MVERSSVMTYRPPTFSLTGGTPGGWYAINAVEPTRVATTRRVASSTPPYISGPTAQSVGFLDGESFDPTLLFSGNMNLGALAPDTAESSSSAGVMSASLAPTVSMDWITALLVIGAILFLIGSE